MTLLTPTPRLCALVTLVREATEHHRALHGLDPACVWVSDAWLNTAIEEMMAQGLDSGGMVCPVPVVAGYPCVWAPGLEGMSVMTRANV